MTKRAARGYFRREGLDVELLYIGGGSLLIQSILGGDVVRPFALLMLFGVIVGTFSSIFIAAPALLEIEKRWPGPAARGHLAPKAPAVPARKPQPAAR